MLILDLDSDSANSLREVTFLKQQKVFKPRQLLTTKFISEFLVITGGIAGLPSSMVYPDSLLRSLHGPELRPARPRNTKSRFRK